MARGQGGNWYHRGRETPGTGRALSAETFDGVVDPMWGGCFFVFTLWGLATAEALDTSCRALAWWQCRNSLPILVPILPWQIGDNLLRIRALRQTLRGDVGLVVAVTTARHCCVAPPETQQHLRVHRPGRKGARELPSIGHGLCIGSWQGVAAVMREVR